MATYNNRLANQISHATSVRGTEVGGFDPRHRSGPRDLLRVSANDDLERLVKPLEIDEDSLLEGATLMTPGDLQLNFLTGHGLLASVVLILPGFLRWDGLPADARLRAPQSLEAWLAAHDWHVSHRAIESASRSSMQAPQSQTLRFRIEYMHKRGPPIVFARRLTPGEFALRDASRLGGVPIEPYVSAPRTLKPDGFPDCDIFAFELVSRADRNRLPVGSEVDLVP